MKRSRQVNHREVAAACRTKPGKWLPVGEYRSSIAAKYAVYYIRKALTTKRSHSSPYTPAGAYEARYTLTEFGALVEARYVGSDGDGRGRRPVVLPISANPRLKLHHIVRALEAHQREVELEELRVRLPLDGPDRHALDTTADVAFARLVSEQDGSAS